MKPVDSLCPLHVEDLLSIDGCMYLQLNFGSIFFGEAVTRSITVFNNGPAEARFDLSYGSKTDMAAIAATDNDGPSVGDDQHAAFLKMARIRVRYQTSQQTTKQLSQQQEADAYLMW